MTAPDLDALAGLLADYIAAEAHYRLALQERRPHMSLSDFGRLIGVGITAPDVQIQRTRVPLPDDETGRRGPSRRG